MLAAGARVGSSEITGPLGAGGMGEVYRARDAPWPRGPCSDNDTIASPRAQGLGRLLSGRVCRDVSAHVRDLRSSVPNEGQTARPFEGVGIMAEDNSGQEGAPAAMPSRGQANPRRGISESSRWGWGPSAIEREVGQEGQEALSRRELLKRAGLVVGAAVVVPVSAAAQTPATARAGDTESAHAS